MDHSAPIKSTLLVSVTLFVLCWRHAAYEGHTLQPLCAVLNVHAFLWALLVLCYLRHWAAGIAILVVCSLQLWEAGPGMSRPDNAPDWLLLFRLVVVLNQVPMTIYWHIVTMRIPFLGLRPIHPSIE